MSYCSVMSAHIDLTMFCMIISYKAACRLCMCVIFEAACRFYKSCAAGLNCMQSIVAESMNRPFVLQLAKLYCVCIIASRRFILYRDWCKHFVVE